METLLWPFPGSKPADQSQCSASPVQHQSHHHRPHHDVGHQRSCLWYVSICPEDSSSRYSQTLQVTLIDLSTTQTNYWWLHVCGPETAGQTNMQCWNIDTRDFENEKEDFPCYMSCYDYWYTVVKLKPFMAVKRRRDPLLPRLQDYLFYSQQ